MTLPPSADRVIFDLVKGTPRPAARADSKKARR